MLETALAFASSGWGDTIPYSLGPCPCCPGACQPVIVSVCGGAHTFPVSGCLSLTVTASACPSIPVGTVVVLRFFGSDGGATYGSGITVYGWDAAAICLYLNVRVIDDPTSGGVYVTLNNCDSPHRFDPENHNTNIDFGVAFQFLSCSGFDPAALFPQPLVVSFGSSGLCCPGFGNVTFVVDEFP